MRVLVTGMTASQTKEGDTVASFIGQSLRDAGHDVTVGRPSLLHALHEDIGGDFGTMEGETSAEPWDWVYVGLGPLHGIGTAYKYGALGLIGRYWNRCTLYLDDIDAGKIGGGFRTMLNVEGKLTRPFFGYCKEWHLASMPDVTPWLLNIVDALANADADDYPNLLVPAFTFDEAFRTAVKVSSGAGPNVVPIDMTAHASLTLEGMAKTKHGRKWKSGLREDLKKTAPWIGKEKWWATELEPMSATVRSYGPFQWHQVRTHKNPALIMLANGLIMPTEQWSPRFVQATSQGIPILTMWRVFAKEIGPSYELLAGTIELMSKQERAELAVQQHAELIKFSPSTDDLAKLVDSLMEAK